MSGLIRCSCDGAVENCVRCSGSGSYLAPTHCAPFSRLKITPPPPPRKTLAQRMAEEGRYDRIGKRKRSRSAKASITAPLERCPVCRSNVRPQRLYNHLRKVHHWKTSDAAAVAPRTTVNGGRKPKSAPSSRSIRPSVPPQSVFGEKLRRAQMRSVDAFDASRNFGFAAREGSRFGSHPLHDAYDDESTA